MSPATQFEFLDYVLIAILSAGIFLWGRFVSVPTMRKAMAVGSFDRPRFYRRAATLLWLCSALLGVDWALSHRSLEALGLVLPLDARFFAGLLLTGGLMAGLIVGTVRLASSGGGQKQKQKLVEKSPLLYAMLPADRREYGYFVGLSVTAGITEELLYRGFLIYALGTYMPLAVAGVLSALLFGLGHGYQGTAGMVKTTVLGLLLALLYIGSGSLLLPMVLHAFLDIQGGTVGLWLKSRAGGVAEPPPG